MNTIFGIMRRAYYLLSIVLCLSFLVTAWDKYSYSQVDFGPQHSVLIQAWQQTSAEQAPMFIIMAFLTIPLAALLHWVVRWVVFGTHKRIV